MPNRLKVRDDILLNGKPFTVFDIYVNGKVTLIDQNANEVTTTIDAVCAQNGLEPPSETEPFMTITCPQSEWKLSLMTWDNGLETHVHKQTFRFAYPTSDLARCGARMWARQLGVRVDI